MSISPKGRNGDLLLLGRWFSKPSKQGLSPTNFFCTSLEKVSVISTLLPNDTYSEWTLFATWKGKRQPTLDYPTKYRKGKN